nr:cupin domain-containing protein [uncultured Draconibacterium sp.]
MKSLVALFHKNTASISILFVVLGVCISCSNTPEIVVQQMKMELPSGKQLFKEELLPGEIADTKIEHIAYVGPTVHKVQLSDENISMFLFVKGNGNLKTDTSSFKLVPESIAIPMTYKSIKIEVPEGEELHFVRFTKKLSEQDIADLNGFPDDSKYDIYFTEFDDCEPYTEKIKSPNTVSRTVLPEHIIPRVALGTVEAPGPDEVGAHKHAMLDQLFLGLTDNDIVVHADGASAEFTEYSLLHIPIGSSHWVSVDENKRMYYLWMDFFLTKEGQEWLKTHKPISTDKDEY